MVTVWFVVRVYRGGSRRIALLRLVKEKKKKKEEKFSRNLESSFPKSWQVKTAKKNWEKTIKSKKRRSSIDRFVEIARNYVR